MARVPEDDDDAALRWDDVDDASYDLRGEPARDEQVAPATDTRLDEARQSRPVAAVAATGVFGGVYLMYVIGWLIGVAQLPLSGRDLLQEITYQFAEFLAIVSPIFWFVTTLVLTRDGSAVHRFGWLALGTLVLVPWPFLLGVIA
ncbi:hypothetical protein EV141_1187 [Microcella putealis]|uniref:DNA polymerase III subunit gamma/tau n=1 Tax=Microcella putealis TaxID=337005 RepID=A0A4Q7LRY9_9MICO|nr:hypothetical protein [Microcella putealis]RZS57474.1 hypothetical protein EV141_1187 [Microcella putealis]TQM24541.1 hypothetical protein BJ957_0796 [Microcella putealis]